MYSTVTKMSVSQTLVPYVRPAKHVCTVLPSVKADFFSDCWSCNTVQCLFFGFGAWKFHKSLSLQIHEVYACLFQSSTFDAHTTEKKNQKIGTERY